MNCIICNKIELNYQTGNPHVHDQRERKATDAICCANCCQILMGMGIPGIPWEGGIDHLRLMSSRGDQIPVNGLVRRKGTVNGKKN